MRGEDETAFPGKEENVRVLECPAIQATRRIEVVGSQERANSFPVLNAVSNTRQRNYTFKSLYSPLSRFPFHHGLTSRASFMGYSVYGPSSPWLCMISDS